MSCTSVKSTMLAISFNGVSGCSSGVVSSGVVLLVGVCSGVVSFGVRAPLHPTRAKSITNAIGVALSTEIGGIAAITTAGIAVTGTFGNIAGPAICRLFRIEDPIAMGVAFGTASHVIGTARAGELSKLAGAVGSFSLTIAGLLTALSLSFLAQYI